MIDASRLAVDEIAGIQRSVIHLQYAVEKMQFFGAGMPMRGIVSSRIKSDQHAYAFDFHIPREYFDVDTGRRFLPLWFNRRFQRRSERPCSRVVGDSVREPTP